MSDKILDTQPEEIITGLSLGDIEAVEDHKTARDYLVNAGTVVALGATAYVTWKYGGDIVDARFTPDVPVVEQITQGIMGTSEGLRAAAPSVVAVAALSYAGMEAKAIKDTAWAYASKASKTEYSGTDNDKQGRRWSRAKKFIAGTALPATLLVTAAAGIEHEVSDGPTRAINKAMEVLSPGEPNPRLVVQNLEAQFMNNSYVTPEGVASLAEAARNHGLTALPFRRELPNLRDESGRSRTALALGVPSPIFNELVPGAASTESINCDEVPVVVDEAADVQVGDTIYLNSQPSKVVATISGASSMNRVAVIQDEKTLAKCFEKNEQEAFYGVVLSGGSDEEIQAAYDESGAGSESVLVTTDDLRNYNRKFWQNNGTPILLQMMGYIAAFGYIANRNEKRAGLQRDIKELGTLNAGGVTIKDLQRIETMRALRETGTAALLAAPLAPAFAAAVNAAEWGLQVGISGREVAVGGTLTLAAKLFGARRAVKKFGKDLTPAEAMKG